MQPQFSNWSRVLPVILCLAATVVPAFGSEDPVDFRTQIRPILEKNCVKCHGAEKQKGGLRLDNKTDALGVNDSGEYVIVPHEPEKSELIALVSTLDVRDRMPLKEDALSSADVVTLSRWIKEGAPWPEEGPAEGQVASKGELTVTAEDREHWAYRPLIRPELPKVANSAWVRTPVDRFILARLEAAHLGPAPEATPVQLRRRLSFTITGLPPMRQMTAEDLLKSAAYGEHWARLWLDVARYADSDGYEADRDRPESWRYRDFVIRAFNEDLPFDQFVRWQLAGDELAPETADAVIATGFLALGPYTEVQPTESFEYREKARYEQLDDIVATTASAFLGLTVGCARCHDHKYDAIPTRDYYALAAAFAGGERGNFPVQRAEREYERMLIRAREAWLERRMEELGIDEGEKELLRLPLKENNRTQTAAWKKWGDQLKPNEDILRRSLSEASRRELAIYEAEVKPSVPAMRTLVWRDKDEEVVANWLLARGDAMRKVEPQRLAFLQVLTHSRTPDDYLAQVRLETRASHSTSQRAALAAWLTDVDQGAGALLARVIVNRLWLGDFGRGLVNTPNDFGMRGDAPTHPELLEWLAAELVDSGWSLKHIQRLILNSATWRQSYVAGGDDQLISRRRAQRLGADALRDSLLSASGELRAYAGGPAFHPLIPAEAMVTRTSDAYPTDVVDNPEVWRRGIYHFIKRSVRYPFTEVFDAPDPTTSSGQRINTIVPTQQLALLNDEFVRARARAFAGRLMRESSSVDGQIRKGFLYSLSRPARPEEVRRSRQFIEQTSLTDWCHALFTLNEIIYVD